MGMHCVEPYISAEWSPDHDQLLCPHCAHEIMINGGDYLDEPYPQDCVWECDNCDEKFAIAVVTITRYRTATEWK